MIHPMICRIEDSPPSPYYEGSWQRAWYADVHREFHIPPGGRRDDQQPISTCSLWFFAMLVYWRHFFGYRK